MSGYPDSNNDVAGNDCTGQFHRHHVMKVEVVSGIAGDY